MKHRTRNILLTLALLTSTATALRAQTYSVGWFSVAGGGGTSAAGVYTVTGTFGQEDAGGPMQGGGFSVEGGFWAPLALQSASTSGTAPSITTPPDAQTVSNGGPASFSVSVSGTPPFFYQWQKNGINLTDGGNISGSTTTNLTLSTTSMIDVSSYAVIIENAYGSMTSSVVNLTGVLPAIVVQPGNLIVTNGDPATFGVSVAGQPSYSAQWQKNGSALVDGGSVSGSSTTNLILGTTGTNDTGGYAVVLANIYGSVTSVVAKLNVLLPNYTAAQNLIYHGLTGSGNSSWAVYNSGPDAIQDADQLASLDTPNYFTSDKWICDTASGLVYHGISTQYGNLPLPSGGGVFGHNPYVPSYVNAVWYVYGSMADALAGNNQLGTITSPGWGEFDQWVSDYATGLVYHGNNDGNVWGYIDDNGNTVLNYGGNPSWAVYNSVSDAIQDVNQTGTVIAAADWGGSDKWFSDPSTGLAYHGLSDASGNPYWAVFPNVADAILATPQVSSMDAIVDWGFSDKWAGVVVPSVPLPITNYPPKLQIMALSGGNLQLSWNTVNTYPPVGYQVEYTTNLAPDSWIILGTVLTGPGPTLSAADMESADSQRYYRIVLVQ